MLSNRLKAARQAAPLTMAALGSKLDPARSRKLILEWEKGRCEPSLSTIEQLAAADAAGCVKKGMIQCLVRGL